MKPGLYIQGMHGMGDCIHQRAVVRQKMQDHRVILETSWPSIYHDLVGPDLLLTHRAVGLRTQSKNAQRETAKFSAMQRGLGTGSMRVAYGGRAVLQTRTKTILEAMCNATGTDFAQADYRLPVPDAWHDFLAEILGPLPAVAAEKPWCVYRPLVARPEWRGSVQRNADPATYAAIFEAIREEFFTISVADLCDGQEWIVGPEAKTDVAFHKGELVFEALAALFHKADLVYTSSGFAAILAPAVGTPCLSVVGGYESTGCHDSGKLFAPYLSIGPRVECSCWTSACCKACDKSIDLDAALPRVKEFVSRACTGLEDA